MKKKYVKLSSELLMVETEGGFMECSVKMASYEVEDFHDYTFEDSFGNASKTWTISWDE